MKPNEIIAKLEEEAMKEIQVNSVPVSRDAKTGPMTATYSSRDTCPKRCPFKHCGCYGEQGHCYRVSHKVDTKQWGRPASELIDQVRERGYGNYVRVNVVGDMAIRGTNHLNSKYVNKILEAYKDCTKVFTYTHCSLTKRNMAIMKEAIYKGFIINASCESLWQVRRAVENHIPSVLTVKKMCESIKGIDGIKYIKCPNQASSGNVTCRECKLCMSGNRKEVVVFEWHSKVKPPKVVMDKF